MLWPNDLVSPHGFTRDYPKKKGGRVHWEEYLFNYEAIIQMDCLAMVIKNILATIRINKEK